MKRFEGKKALIFGGSSGIGRATAHSLAREGASVILSSNDREQDERVLAEFKAEGVTAWSITRDYTTEASVREVFNFAEQQTGVPDIIICSGGMGDNVTAMEAVTPRVMETVFRVNITGPYLVLQEGIKRLQDANRYGKIIVLGSICSHYTCKNGLFPVYAASKAAIGSLMESTRRQVCKAGNTIGFSLVCPGTTNTKLVLGETGEPHADFMDVDAVAQSIVAAAAMPQEASITDWEVISVRQDIFYRAAAIGERCSPRRMEYLFDR